MKFVFPGYRTYSARGIVCFSLLVCACLSGVYAQQSTIVLEAEDATLTPPVKKKKQNGYSYVGDNDAGSCILFSDVRVERDGMYEFRIHYTCTEARSLAVRSGGFEPVVVTVMEKTPGWDELPTAMMKCYIYMKAGSNTLEITPYNGAGPNIDKFEVVDPGWDVPLPEPVKMAWQYDLTDDAVSVTLNGETAEAALTDNDEATSCTYTGGSATVHVECDMPYLLTGYYLSAGTESELSVKNWRMEYSADGTTWQSLTPDSQEEYDYGTLYVLDRTVRDAAAQHYRITAVGGEVGEIQLFGIPFLANTNGKNFPEDLVTGVNYVTYAHGNPLGVYDYGSFDERYYNLFNRNMMYKYYWDGAQTFEVDIELPGMTRLASYTLTSCQDYPERDPKAWVVEGFDRDWEVISEVNDFTFPARYATMKFAVDTDKEYKGFRLRTTQNNGGSAFQLLKWQLFGETRPSAVPDVDDADGVSVLVAGREVVIRATATGEYRVFDLAGRVAASGCWADGEECRVALPAGVYVVHLLTAEGNHAEKVIVK